MIFNKTTVWYDLDTKSTTLGMQQQKTSQTCAWRISSLCSVNSYNAIVVWIWWRQLTMYVAMSTVLSRLADNEHIWMSGSTTAAIIYTTRCKPFTSATSLSRYRRPWNAAPHSVDHHAVHKAGYWVWSKCNGGQSTALGHVHHCQVLSTTDWQQCHLFFTLCNGRYATAKFSKSRVWEQFLEGSILIFGDTLIFWRYPYFLKYSVG